MTILGAGFISISDGRSGTPSSPSGDRLLIWCVSWSVKENNAIKPKQVVDGSSYTTTKGKKQRLVNMRKCVIIDDDAEATTNTQSLNNKLNYLRENTKITGIPVYLIINASDDDVNIHLADNQDYLKGYVKDIEYSPEGNHYMLNISFVESTLL